jgi:hypothetical protein
VQQANVWDQVLFGRHPPNADAVRKRDGFKKWLTEKFARNEPYDHWVRDLLLAEQAGSQVFLVQFRGQPEDATVAVSRIFLGTQLQCARCHDHPSESWTQREFYGMTGFFVRLVVLDRGPEKFAIGEKGTGEALVTGAVKEQKPGQKREPIKAKFLGGPIVDEPPLPKGYKEPPPGSKTFPKPAFSRKEKPAAWVVAPESPYLAKAVANRTWGQFFGRGLVHPIDDLGEKRTPSHPALFEALTKQLVARKYDLKWCIRELVNTDAYQLTAGTATEALPRWFERGPVRALSAEELMAAMRQATGYDKAATKPGEPLPDAGDEYFQRYFGEPTNGIGEFQGSLAEHLFLNNSENIRLLAHRRKGNLADTMLTSNAPWEERVEQLFLATLNRPPKPPEQKRFVAHLQSDKNTEPLVEEAIWVLLNTAEFRVNH